MNYPSGFFWFNVRSTEQYQWSLMTSNFIDFTQEGKREMERRGRFLNAVSLSESLPLITCLYIVYTRTHMKA